MTTLDRTIHGAATGVLAAWLAFPAMFSFFDPSQKIEPAIALVMMPFILFFLVISAGPGALVLAWIHATQLARWAPRAGTRRQIRQVGILLGIPLGIVNLAIVFSVPVFLGGHDPQGMLDQRLVPWLIPAIAGGAGLGWGATIGLEPGRTP